LKRRRPRSKARIVYELLLALQRRGPMAPSRLATLLGLPYDRLSSLLDELQRRGLVARREEGGHTVVEATEEGGRALASLARALRVLEELGLE